MKTVILAMLVGLSFSVLIPYALRHAHDGGGSRRMRLTLGVIIGLLAAFAVLVVRTDLVPDGIEQGLWVAAVLLTAVVTGFAAWYLRGV